MGDGVLVVGDGVLVVGDGVLVVGDGVLVVGDGVLVVGDGVVDAPPRIIGSSTVSCVSLGALVISGGIDSREGDERLLRNSVR